MNHALSERGISFVAEYQLGPGSRIDFLAIGGTGLEIKKRSPCAEQVLEQIQRYTSCDTVKALVLVTPSTKYLRLPKTVNEKPVYIVSLNRLWWVTL